MHELGIAQSVLDAVAVEAARHPGARPVKVVVRVGELAAVDPDALQFSFEVLTSETEFQDLQLEIEICPRRHRCLECETEFDVKDLDFRCPRCGAVRNQCVSGDQLELGYLELEDHESSTA
jgi:hydrogenase nickel incorporation protein HypA/HybF